MSYLKQVDQISIVVKDIEKAMRLYGNLFQLSNWNVITPEYKERTFRGQPGDFKLKVAQSNLGSLQLELVQPLEGRSANAEFLLACGEKLHHVGVFVSDIKNKIMDFEKRGFVVVQSGKRPGVEFAYLQNEAESSVIIELIERS